MSLEFIPALCAVAATANTHGVCDSLEARKNDFTEEREVLELVDCPFLGGELLVFFNVVTLLVRDDDYDCTAKLPHTK
jgi:hypothetical protein